MSPIPTQEVTKMRKNRRHRGTALITVFVLMALLSIGAVTYISTSTQTMREARHKAAEVQATNLCESGVQAVLHSLWRPFKINQDFEDMEDRLAGASPSNPRLPTLGEIPGVGKFAAGVTQFYSPNGDQYSRIVNVRVVGFLDRNNNNAVDAGEARKTVDVTARFELARSAVFDYTYFINNYGWMDGFGVNDLIVNGDMRANANFDFLNGSPTINGSIIAANNDKLSPPAAGLINQPPVKWATNTYRTNWNNTGTAHRTRWRQPYDPAVHGAIGSAQFEQWRDLVYMSDATLQNNRPFGAAMMDARGVQAWQRTSVNGTTTLQTLDTQPTEEIVMPDLSDLAFYTNLSQTYVNPKQNWGDGTPNPNFNQGARVEVWDSTLNAYRRLDTNGVINGSAVLIGTSTNPIRIHGPVTVTQDVVIKGHIQGQGTLYAGRNTHIVGSIRYVNPPDFRGTNMLSIEHQNEKRDFLGLAARGSVIMGNPTTFGNPWPLRYMTPPFTKGRFDENGNWVPPFNAMEVDSSGRMRYQSVIPDSQMSAIAEGVNQVDAILYTNFVGGGNVGVGGGGMTLNGTIIAKDEAIVTWSLPIRLNYDNRIRERGVTRTPLIDLQLPRSPTMLRSTWQDRGFQSH